MKKILFFLLLISAVTFAQAPPQGISHRGTVYNASNVLMPNTPVKIRISILDNNATGTEVYKEIHSLTTNNQGQYSLNIGQGLNPTVAFNTINWGLNLKYLKVEISFNTSVTISSPGSSFAVSGDNQLMSVPYALYALNSQNSQNSQIRVYKNVAELRAAAATGTTNEIAYIKGHTTPGDGGEGNFLWRGDLPSVLTDNDGIIVRDDPTQNQKGWIRIMDDRINVKYFGIKFDNTDGVVIQKAIDFAKLNVMNYQLNQYFKFRDLVKSSSTVYIPAGDYNIAGTLTLKYGVSIEGDNMLTTRLVATNSPEGGSMFDLDEGQVTGVNVSNLTLDGNATDTTTPKHAMNLVAHGGSGTGGLWVSTFKNINIKNFNGSGIILEGSGINDLNRNFLNQGCIFENVGITRRKDNSSCLLIKGNLGQFTFIGCGFDGLPPVSTETTFTTNKFYNVAILTNQVEAAVIKFITCTFQYSEYGVYTSYAESVTFDNCWFEYLDTAIAATNSSANTSKSINVLNCRFANASGFGSEWNKVSNSNHHGNINSGGQPDEGACISVEGGAVVNAMNNFVRTSNPNVNPGSKFIKNYGFDSVINASNNAFYYPVLGKTYGVSNNERTLTSGTLDCSGYKFLSVKTYSDNITELKSTTFPGETMTIKAVGGSLKFDGSKNIVFSKSSITPITPFILNNQEIATFMKTDIPRVFTEPITNNIIAIYENTWVLISVNKTY